MSKTAENLLIVAASTSAIYIFLAVAVRILGRRQLGQLTALDLLIVILLGSAVETAMVHGDSSLKAGLVSGTTLFVLNRIAGGFLRRSRRFARLCGTGPILLVHNGQFVEEHLRRVGLTHEDVLHALRQRECCDMGDVRFAVLESDGQVNVVSNDAAA